MIKVPEKHSPSPSEVTDYTCNTEASLDGDGFVPGVGARDHSAAETQYVRTHTQPDLESKGEAPARAVKKQSRVTEGRHVSSRPGLDVTAERQRTNQASRKAAETDHEAQTKRVQGREWAATVKSV